MDRTQLLLFLKQYDLSLGARQRCANAFGRMLRANGLAKPASKQLLAAEEAPATPPMRPRPAPPKAAAKVAAHAPVFASWDTDVVEPAGGDATRDEVRRALLTGAARYEMRDGSVRVKAVHGTALSTWTR
jgi:hypothetical protein